MIYIFWPIIFIIILITGINGQNLVYNSFLAGGQEILIYDASQANLIGIQVETNQLAATFTNCQSYSRLNSTILKCITPATVYPGPARVRYQFAGGQWITSTTTVRYSDPGVTSVSPSTGLLLAGGQQLTITGTFGYCVNSVCPDMSKYQILIGDRFNCSAITRVSDTQLSCTTPLNIGGQGVSISVIIDGVYASEPKPLLTFVKPTITSINPTSGSLAPGSATKLTVTGTGFGNLGATDGLQVIFTHRTAGLLPVVSDVGGAVVTVSDTQLQMSIPIIGFDPSETYDVSVATNGYASTDTGITYQNTGTISRPSVSDVPLSILENGRVDQSFVIHNIPVYIFTLPQNGVLYQYDSSRSANNFKGTVISTVPTLLTDSARRIVYEPKIYWNGVESFEFYTKDSTTNYASRPGTVTITVQAVDQLPVPIVNTTWIYTDDSVEFTLKATDIESAQFNYSITEYPSRGQLYDLTNGNILINSTLLPYYFGGIRESVKVKFVSELYDCSLPSDKVYATFKFTAFDRQYPSTDPVPTPATVTVKMNCRNHPPVVFDRQVLAKQYQTPLLLQFFATEHDRGETPAIYVATLPKYGNLFQGAGGAPINTPNTRIFPDSNSGSCKTSYVPNYGFYGNDTFLFYAADAVSTSNNATYTVSIDFVNEVPSFKTIQDESTTTLTMYESTPTVQIEITGTDQDETNQLTVVPLKAPKRGKWKVMSTDLPLGGNIPLLASKNFSTYLTIEHDDMGGAYPYVDADFNIVDSKNTMGGTNLTFKIFVKCNPERYNNIWEPTNSSMCLPCLKGADCWGDGDVFPTNKLGYYPIKPNKFVPCIPDDACPANALSNGGTFMCAPGYEGVRCAVCQRGYYKYNTVCHQCPLTSLSFEILVGACVGVLLIFIGLLYLMQNYDMGFVNILITYLQTVALFGYLRLDWPETVKWLFKIASVLNLDVELLFPECFFVTDNYKAYEFKFYLSLAIPAALGVVVIALNIVFFLFGLIGGTVSKQTKLEYEHWEQERHDMPGLSDDDDYDLKPRKQSKHIEVHPSNDFLSEDDGRNRSISATLISIYVLALKIAYLNLVKRTLELYDCSFSRDEDFYFEVETNRTCFEGQWWKDLLPYSLGAFGLYVLGIPALHAALGLMRMRILKIDNVKRSAWQRFILQITYKKQKEFKADYEFWESVISLRKCGIVIVQLMFTNYAQFQTVVMILVFQVSLLLQSHFQPYAIKSLNFLETAILFSSTLVLSTGILSHVTASTDKTTLGIIMVTIISFSGLLVCVLIFNYLRERRGIARANGKAKLLARSSIAQNSVRQLIAKTRPGMIDDEMVNLNT